MLETETSYETPCSSVMPPTADDAQRKCLLLSVVLVSESLPGCCGKRCYMGVRSLQGTRSHSTLPR